MPYKSEAQRRFFHSKGAKKHGITPAMVHEWDQASKGKDLPERVKEGTANPAPVARGPNMPRPPSLGKPRETPERALNPMALNDQSAGAGSNKALGSSDTIFSNGAHLTMPVTQ